MLWKYLSETYKAGEPIIASDITLNMTDVNRRRQFKLLTDEGKIRRYEHGIYYIPKKLRLGGEISLPPELVVEYKYISRLRRTMGYYSGYSFANRIGVSTQMPYVQEIVTNEMGNPIKRIEKDSCVFVVRKSRTEITDQNVKTLQLLDLLKDLDMYSEMTNDEIRQCLSRYINSNNIRKSDIDKYLPLYPDKIYKSIYETGLTNVFTQ